MGNYGFSILCAGAAVSCVLLKIRSPIVYSDKGSTFPIRSDCFCRSSTWIINTATFSPAMHRYNCWERRGTRVEGVLVGHTTLIEGDGVRTGVTAILPHGGNAFQQKVPAAVYVGSGFGPANSSKLESPILFAT